MDKFRLRALEEGDIVLLANWLKKEHVKKWYEHPEEWLREAKEREGEFSFLNHYIVEIDGAPVGFCQYYDCFAADEDWYCAEAPRSMFSIDYMVGEEAYLKRGVGRQIVIALMRKIADIAPGAEIVVQPDGENIASNRLLLSCGFAFDDAKEYYSIRLDQVI